MELDLEPQAGVDSGAAVDLERELKLAWETERKGLAEAHGAAMDVGTLALLKELLRTALRTEREVRVDKVEERIPLSAIARLPDELILLITANVDSWSSLLSLASVARRFYLPARQSISWTIRDWSRAVEFAELVKAHPLFASGVHHLVVEIEMSASEDQKGSDAAQCSCIVQIVELCTGIRTLRVEALPDRSGGAEERIVRAICRCTSLRTLALVSTNTNADDEWSNYDPRHGYDRRGIRTPTLRIDSLSTLFASLAHLRQLQSEISAFGWQPSPLPLPQHLTHLGLVLRHFDDTSLLALAEVAFGPNLVDLDISLKNSGKVTEAGVYDAFANLSPTLSSLQFGHRPPTSPAPPPPLPPPLPLPRRRTPGPL